ncbi:beta-1,4-glucuronyltransferase 1-like isoform X2 [Rhynchophorus ferrugineus]|uniref:beta-1,4-glucuronyltransferase 1-like isoform X2 n=1 Tax=Rhynchophorus ferrugineus TaxID=354439 RepID=UPI003FCC6ADE
MIVLRQARFQLLLTGLVALTFFFFLNTIQHINLFSYNGDFMYDYSDKNPGAYVKYVHPVPSNVSYCRFNYRLPKEFTFSAEDLRGTPEYGLDSPFVVLYNVVQGTSLDDRASVTYATQLSKNFFPFLTEIVRYWDGPVSVAAYVSDGDLDDIIRQLLEFCHCVPEMSKVSLHFVLKKDYVNRSNIYVSAETFVPSLNCDIQKLANAVIQSTISESSFRVQNNSSIDWYPINVCRNVAREAAYTDYVMVCDVELMPSQGLVTRFIHMVSHYECPTDCDRTIYVVPIFEVEDTEQVPRSKPELVSLIDQEKAVYFHRKVCMHCQKFPGLEKWKNSDPGDTIKPLLVTKREMPYNRWEPIFIGTKKEPLYNEKLSWEGYQDKMLQMLEICLMKYNLVVLDGAFLVHWPGMKKSKSKENDSRKIFKQMNQRQYNLLLKNLTSKYLPNPQCKIK